jgi:nucleotide-binding universal stress UspA family protein
MDESVKGILVGFDGSRPSGQALEWAVEEARARAMNLTICHAWSAGDGAPGDGAAAGLARDYGEQVLAGGLCRARARIGSDAVRPLLASGSAARVLCEHSGAAAMVVVGSRGRGGLSGLLLGSVSLQVAAYARAPVIVVRGPFRPAPGHLPGPVVVGADGSAASRAAVAFAFEEAALRDAPLEAACALSDAAGVLNCARQIEQDFAASLDACQPRYPDVAVRRLVSQGSPRTALLEAAAIAQAQLLVVGARGRGGLNEMMLGSVSLALLHHAPCPVAVVRRR